MHTLMHIGAGHGSELAEWLASDAERIVLVEPHPELAEQLRIMAENEARVTVVEAAITPDPSRHELLAFNLPDAHSLREPTALTQLFPGLKRVERHPVQTMPPAELLDASGPGSDEPGATLILEAPGEEQAILQALIDGDRLQRFSQLRLTASPEPLFEGSVGAPELLQALQAYGYEITAEDQQDPDWPRWQLQLNPLKRHLTQLQAELAATQQARDEAEKAIADRQEAHAEAQATLNKQLIEQLEALVQKEKALTELMEQRDQQDEALAEQKAQREKLDTQLKAVQEELTATQQARTEGEKAKAEAEKVIAESHQATQQAQQEAQAANSELANLKQQLTEQHETLAQKEKALTELMEQRDQQDEALAEQKAQREKLDTQLKAVQEELTATQQARAEAEKAMAEAEKVSTESQEARAETQSKLEQTHTWFMNRKQQAEEQADTLQVRDAELARLKREHEALQVQLSEAEKERDQYQRYFQNRKKEHQAAQASLEEVGKALRDKDAVIARLSEQLAAQQQGEDATRSRLGELEGKLDQLFGEQRHYIQQTTSALGQHVTRSARQQRDEQALAHYLHHGRRLPGAEVLPAQALALLEYHQQQRHDLVLVFGMASLTELLARVAMPDPRLEGSRDNSAGQQRIAPSQGDLPQRIISVEHRQQACRELEGLLASAGTAGAVTVKHAPWVAAASDQLFYACEPLLERLYGWLDDAARVLVVVGQALPEAGHSRQAALATLLQRLPTQRLDLVLPHADGHHEEALPAQWQRLLDARQREWSRLDVPQANAWRIDG